MSRMLAPCVFAVLATLHGCVIPTGHMPETGYIPSQVMARLNTAESTRAEVLMTLGVPDHRYCADRAFRYAWKETVAMVLFPAGYQVGGFAIHERRNVLIEFDAQGGTRRVDVIAALSLRELNAKEGEWLKKMEACPQ